MELLIATKPIRSDNELLKPGEKFIIEDGQILLDRRYARRLTKYEAQAILNEYVKYSEDLFSKEPEKKPILAIRDRKAVYQGRLL